jgi:nucleoside-diphosphate-sugar epimerase
LAHGQEGIMNVFIAGGSGAIGVPLVRALVAGGHQVTALTRSSSKEPMLRALGATPAVADALDALALRRVVVAAHPTHVVHQLTALPQGGPKSAKELAPTNRLRIDGTRNLVDAAVAAGAKRFVVGSFAVLAAAKPGVPSQVEEAAAAMRSMESQVLAANARHLFEGIILRYGLFYGPDNGMTKQMIALALRRLLPAVRGDQGLLPPIHLEDAASATVAALEHGTPGSIYDIVDDQPVSISEMARTIAETVGAPKPFAIPSWLPRVLAPYLAQLLSVRLPLSNTKARAELGWRPMYPTIREGYSDALQPSDSTPERRMAHGKRLAQGRHV